MTDFFETRVENMEPKEDKKKILQLPKKEEKRKAPRSVKEQTPDSVVEWSKESSMERRPNRKCCILHGK